MAAMEVEPVSIAVGDVTVSGLLAAPPDARACYVLAHGAGAGMAHPFLAGIAGDLFERGIASLRYQFPYREAKRRRPDPPAIAEAAVAAAVEEAARRMRGTPLVAGGKSFGGRMTSQAQAAGKLPGVRGLAFLGFPLHPPGKPSDARGEHLSRVTVPMLFLQGTRDEFAELKWLEPLCERLKPLATLRLVDDADHSFHVPAQSGRKDAEVRAELADILAAWIKAVVDGRSSLP